MQSPVSMGARMMVPALDKERPESGSGTPRTDAARCLRLRASLRASMATSHRRGRRCTRAGRPCMLPIVGGHARWVGACIVRSVHTLSPGTEQIKRRSAKTSDLFRATTIFASNTARAPLLPQQDSLDPSRLARMLKLKSCHCPSQSAYK
jgi:hypothetical protein